jgi:hypothetical protein
VARSAYFPSGVRIAGDVLLGIVAAWHAFSLFWMCVDQHQSGHAEIRLFPTSKWPHGLGGWFKTTVTGGASTFDLDQRIVLACCSALNVACFVFQLTPGPGSQASATNKDL